MKILIGTKNPSKIEGVKRAFLRYFDEVEIEGVDVSSNVPDQPFNEDVLQGAKNRANAAKEYAEKNGIEADYFAGVEAGILELYGEALNFNIACVVDKDGVQSIGISQGFPIPDKYLEKIRQTSLGVVMDEVFSGNELGRSVGGISYLTKDNVTRMDIIDSAFTMALVKMVNGDTWR